MAGKRGRRKKVETVAEQPEQVDIAADTVKEVKTEEVVNEAEQPIPEELTSTVQQEEIVEEPLSETPQEVKTEEPLSEITQEAKTEEADTVDTELLEVSDEQPVCEDTIDEKEVEPVLPKIEEVPQSEPEPQVDLPQPETNPNAVIVPATDNTMIQISKIIAELKKNPMYKYLAKTTLIRIAHKRLSKKNIKFLNNI